MSAQTRNPQQLRLAPFAALHRASAFELDMSNLTGAPRFDARRNGQSTDAANSRPCTPQVTAVAMESSGGAPRIRAARPR